MDTSPGTRPNCKCHDVPMWVAHAAEGTWRCRVKLSEYRTTDEWRAHVREKFHEKTWVERNRLLLRARRRKALKRRAEREARYGAV